MKVDLSEKDRQELERIARSSRDGHLLKRAQSLLALAEGEPLQQLIGRMRIGRSTLYEWVWRLEEQTEEPLPLRLADRPRPGRPAEKRRTLKKRLEALMQQKPAEYGYRYADWTAELLTLQAGAEGLAGQARTVRRAWRGWRIVLFLDRASAHEAAASRALALRLGVELRRLPTACPELNPLEGLWRWLKGKVLANRQLQPFTQTVQQALSALDALRPQDVLRISGVTSGDFWMAT